MSKLTENTVLARTRSQDLKSVRKLNCWGSELTDVSIIKQLPNVEVLSLSVNCISGLEDFAECNNLQELYIRKNNISSLGEIRHLQNLPKLRNLWLADNPCAEAAQYRLTVIRALPNLHKLDNLPVRPEEVDSANQLGIPLDSLESSSTSARSVVETTVTHEEVVTSRSEKGNVSSESSSTHHKTVSSSQSSSQSWTVEFSSSKGDDGDAFPPLEIITAPAHTSSVPESSPEENLQVVEPPVQKSVASLLEKSHQPENRETVHENIRSSSEPEALPNAAISGSENDRVSPRCTFTNAYSSRSHPKPDRMSPMRMLPKGGKHRNSNILSAVLCLIKELDLASLEVVDTAIHCQMEEYAEEDQNTN